jgi:hypothetical protein
MAASRAHPDRQPRLLCVVQIVLRRGRADRRVSEPQINSSSLQRCGLYRSLPSSLPFSLAPATPWKRITTVRTMFPALLCPDYNFTMALFWLASAYSLWFTRERSKVRSLVRPPCFALRAAHGAASHEIQGEACPAQLERSESGDGRINAGFGKASYGSQRCERRPLR